MYIIDQCVNAEPQAPSSRVPLPHVAVQCMPGYLALRWLYDAHGTTRLTLLVQENRNNSEGQSHQFPDDARDVVGCVAFAAAVAGVVCADAQALGEPPRVIRIPVGSPATTCLALELCWAHEAPFSLIVAEPRFRSPRDTLTTLNAFIEAVAGQSTRSREVTACPPPTSLMISDASAVQADTFALVQRQAPASISGVLPLAYRQALAEVVKAAEKRNTGSEGSALL